MLVAKLLCISSILLVDLCYALTNITVSFEKDACESSKRAVNDTTIYHVTYDGSPIDYLLCNMMKFYGGDSSLINEYKVCISLLQYDDPDCVIWFGYILTTAETRIFNCTVRPPPTWCCQVTDMMRIQIKVRTNVTSTENVRFRMSVFGKLVTNYVLILSGSIGGSVGGLILIYTAVKLFLYIRKNTRY